jgi:hypothetical protein
MCWTRRRWSASSGSMRLIPSSTWRLKLSSGLPTETRFPPSNPISPAFGAFWSPAGAAPLVRQIVLASSDKAYGDQPILPNTETNALQGPPPL